MTQIPGEIYVLQYGPDEDHLMYSQPMWEHERACQRAEALAEFLPYVEIRTYHLDQQAKVIGH